MGDYGGKFAKAAKELKEETRVTLREIAATCNSSESMVSRYINGQSEPPPDIADAIMQMLRSEKAAQDERAMRSNTTLAIVFLLIDIFNGGLGWVRY